MKLVAMINNCQQYSPDDFEDHPELLEITPLTTVADLINWQKNIFSRKDDFVFDVNNFHQIRIAAVKEEMLNQKESINAEKNS